MAEHNPPRKGASLQDSPGKGEVWACLEHGLPLENIAAEGQDPHWVCPAGCNKDQALVGWRQVLSKETAKANLAAWRAEQAGAGTADPDTPESTAVEVNVNGKTATWDPEAGKWRWGNGHFVPDDEAPEPPTKED